MTLVRTSFLNFIAVGIRLLSTLVLNKILALEIGPSGYGLVGQLQNAITSITAIASAGVGTGVTKYTAEFNSHIDKRHEIWVTATFLGVLMSLMFAFFLIFFRDALSQWLFKTDIYENIFIWVAACLVFYVLNTLLLSIINGLKEISLYVMANIANSLLALIVTVILVWLYDIEGALIALAINQSVACIATMILVRKRIWFIFQNFIGFPSGSAVFKLLQFSMIAAATSILGPISIIIVRDMIINNIGITAAGYWEALTRISSLSFMLITAPIAIYYLPRLSELSDSKEIRAEISRGIIFLVPLAAIVAIIIYYSRNAIVNVLFSSDFLPMSDLFLWQLVGDVIRVSGWLLSYYLISKAKILHFLIVEIFVTVTYVFIVRHFIESYGLQGVTIAYAFNNLIYLVLLYYIVSKLLRPHPQT